ncbi:MAG TPA: hypothetical protein VF068_02715 [Rubrobacter sp.]
MVAISNLLDGNVTYTPNRGFTDIDAVRYKVCDDDGDCSQANVQVTVDPVDCNADGVIRGTSGADILRGAPGNDVICAFGGIGDDTIIAGGDNDNVNGGTGNDTINAGPGDDTVMANDGQLDSISCGLGTDVDFVDQEDLDAENTNFQDFIRLTS